MFNIPTLVDLTSRARTGFRKYLPGSDAWLFPNNLGPTAKVIAGMGYEVFGFADYIARQRFAGTADAENLDLHGQEYGLARRPATAAVGQVTVTAADAISVAGGAILQRSDGVQYLVGAGGVLATAGTLTLSVSATVDGKTTNANAGTSLIFESGVVDTNGDAAVTVAVAAGGLVGGYDVEADGDYWTSDLGTFRGRILFRKRNPIHGGAPADYVQWASEVAGVTRVYVERRYLGAGTVRVFVLMDDLYANGIPTPADIARVQGHIDTLAPAGALAAVVAPTPLAVDVQISGLTPMTADVENAVLAELASAFRRLARPAGSDVVHASMPYLAYPTSFSRSWLWQAVANASGEQRHVLALPAADVAQATAQMPVLGNVTFV